MIYTIFKKEVFQYLSTATGYISMAVFLLATWLFCWVIPSTSFVDFGFAEMDSFFEIAPYILLFLVPALTMRLFSEEFKSGTFELLITKPIGRLKIIFGKYLSAWFLILITLLFTIVYFTSLYQMANPIGNIDSSGILGSYLGLWLLGGVFCAIGVFASCLSDNQIIAFIISFVLSYILYDGISRIAEIESLSGDISYFLQNFSLLAHYESLGRGVVDSRDLLYFLGLIFLFLYSSKIVLGIKKQ
jgi:ABC-2 type transport system permease protein